MQEVRIERTVVGRKSLTDASCIFVELNKMEQARYQSRAQRWTHVEGGEWLVLGVCWWTIMTISETAARWQ